MSGRGRSNYRGSGGGRSNYRGSSSRGGGRGRGGRGGRGSSNKDSYLNPCNSFTMTGNCQHGNNCHNGHLIRFYKAFPASNPQSGYSQQSNDRLYSLKDVAFWDNNGQMQIFTGGDDGFWRLWSPASNFAKSTEQNMNGTIECLKVVSNYLFCGFEGPANGVPMAKAGHVRAWNLSNPVDPPLELYYGQAPYEYAHNLKVTALDIQPNAGGSPRIITGSADGLIRSWSMQQPNKFVCEKTLPGHAGEVTGLVLVPGGNILWSSSQDGTIRIWDLAQPEPNALQHTITAEPSNPNSPQQGSGIGHTGAVLALVPLIMDKKMYIISGSVDNHIKVWDSTNGNLMTDENQGEGVRSMTVATTAGGTQVLLIGTTKGNISLRNITATTKLQPFQLLCTLSQHSNAGHRGAVTSIVGGSQGTFYSTGNDGQCIAWHLPPEFETFTN